MTTAQLLAKVERLKDHLAPDRDDMQVRCERLQARFEDSYRRIDSLKQEKKRFKMELSAKRKERERLEAKRKQQEASDAEFKRQREEYWEEIFQQAEAQPSLWPEVLELAITTPYYREAKARSQGRKFTDLALLLKKGKSGKKIW
jgi:hypothetical protein